MVCFRVSSSLRCRVRVRAKVMVSLGLVLEISVFPCLWLKLGSDIGLELV